MADLRERFRAADAVTAPDLWPDIRERTPGPRVPQSRPYAAVAVGLAIATAGIVLAVSVFANRGPGVRPAGPRPNGPIAFSASSTAPGGPRREAIFLLTAAGDVKQITPVIGLSDPAWSPDGTRIAVTTGSDRRRGGIGVMNADGTHLHAIVTSTSPIGQPWSPDGTGIAFARLHDIEVNDAAGGDPRVLSSYAGAVVQSPAWSPDGSAVAYVRVLLFPGPPGPFCPSGSKEAGIVVVELQGSPAQRLTTSNCDSSPVWSPDGRRIAFARTAPDAEWSRIIVMRADGSIPQTVYSCASPRGHATCGLTDLSWSPDGKQLAFVRAGAIHTMDATGGGALRVAIPPELQVTSVSWGPAAVSATPQPTPSQTETSGGSATTAQTLARLPGTTLRLVATRDAVYTLDSDNVLDPTRRIIRFDLGSGRLTTSGPLWGALDLAVTDASVWVSGGNRGSAGSGIIYRLDPTTLRRQESVTLPDAAGHLAAGPTGVWVAAGKAALLIDALTGRVIRSVTLPEVAGDLAIGPSDRVYVETHRVGDLTPGPLEEFDASSGRFLASGPGPGGVAWISLSADQRGVWASFATGMLGGAEHWSAPDLRPSASLNSGHGRSRPASNGIEVAVAGGVLWVFDQGAERYACGDPVTGTRRAMLGFRFTDVADANGTVYAIGEPVPERPVFDLIRITPGPDCLG